MVALAELAVVTGDVAFNQRLDLRGLRLPERVHGVRRVQPFEKHIAGQVVTLLQGLPLRAEEFRALAIYRGDFIGQQTQVVLRVGIPDAVTQAALIGGLDVRHAERGAPDFGTHVR